MKKIKIDLYDCEVFFTTNKDEYSKVADNEICSLFLTTCVGHKVYILIGDTFGGSTSPAFLQCLSHECNHAAMHILGFVGVKFGFENQEPLCYLQDFIFRKCYEYALRCGV
jgi:hypothetical protein